MSLEKLPIFKCSAISIACTMAFSSGALFAAEASDESIHELATVTVHDVFEENGQVVLDAEKLEMTPSTTGTITDLLRSESSIQFDQNSRSSGNGGDFTPPQISIRGARHYENNFTINGLSNNSMLMPSGWSSKPTPRALPFSDAQAVMVPPELLDTVSVFSENIGAEYGDFTGGVIDARVRDALTDRWHINAWVRHTRDAWAHQFWNEKQADNMTPAASDGAQKDFKRTHSGVTMEGPLADGKLGAMVSYTNSHSSMPVYILSKDHIDKMKAKRDHENFMMRVNTDKANDFYAAATLMYSPYESENYSLNELNSRYANEGGGWNFTLNTRANLSFGTWTNDFGFSLTESSTDTDTNITSRWVHTPDGYANWVSGVSNGITYADEGASGDREFTQDQYNFKSILALNPIKTGDVTHNIRVGGEYMYTKVASDTDDWVDYNVNATSLNNRVQGSKTDGIIAGEQAAMKRVTFRGVDRDLDINEFSFFVEDKLQIERFTVRPGVRVSYDDLTEDVNVAPRFFANMDILNDGRFNVNVGANRYYGSQVLYNAIGQGNMRYPSRYWETRHWADETNGILTGWAPDPNHPGSTDTTDLGKLSTPYADEFVLGASANVANTLFKIKGVAREHKDQLRFTNTNLDNPHALSEMENSGKTKYKGITFSAEKSLDLGSFGRHSGEFGITWSETKTNSLNFSNAWNDAVVDYVYIDGAKTDMDDVKSPNFNAEWVITYNHDASFMNDRLRASMLMRWESGSERLVKTNDIGSVAAYYTLNQDHMFNTDLSLAYDLVKTSNTTVTLNLDALNLFDNKNMVNTSFLAADDDVYAMGRQFFLGINVKY